MADTMQITGKLTVCYYNNGDGTASQAGKQIDGAGNYFDFGAVPSYPLTISTSPAELAKWQAAGYLIHIINRNLSGVNNSMISNNNSALSKTQNSMNGINPNNPILPARTTGNEIDLVRIDAPSNVQDNLTWRFTLDNRLGAGVLKGIIGDPTDLIKTRLAIPAPPAGSVETGVFGLATLGLVKNLILKGNTYAYNFQTKVSAIVGLDAADLYTFFPIQEAVGDLQGSITTRDMDFESMQSGDQFNEKYRLKKDWKYLFAALNGLVYTIPVGYSITITMIIKSYASAELQGLIK